MLPQINAESKGGKPIAFRSKLVELVRHFRHKGGLAAFERLVAEGSLSAEGAALSRAALRAIGSAIVKGPVQFAGNARGEPEFTWDKDSNRILVPADVGYWRMVADRFPARFGREASALLGSTVAPAGGWEKPLLSGFVEAVEYTASVRGAERWEPESG